MPFMNWAYVLQLPTPYTASKRNQSHLNKFIPLSARIVLILAFRASNNSEFISTYVNFEKTTRMKKMYCSVKKFCKEKINFNSLFCWHILGITAQECKAFFSYSYSVFPVTCHIHSSVKCRHTKKNVVRIKMKIQDSRLACCEYLSRSLMI